MTRPEFEKLSLEMADATKADLHNACMKAYDKLTPSEQKYYDIVSRPYFIVRAIGMCVGKDVIANRYNAEAIKNLTRTIKRILNKRQY